MFAGEKYHLRPHHSPGLLPLFKLLGTMIAHSLTQDGPGFPYFPRMFIGTLLPIRKRWH